MLWASATAWAASLTVGGFTWRLPTALNPDGSGPCSGFNCSGSEMGYLFYDELGITLGDFIVNSGDPDLGLFLNVQSNVSVYWSGTVFANAPVDAWFFSTLAFQSAGNVNSNNFAWAVRSGDVSVVPLPAAAWLFGSGLIGLLGVARRRKR